MQALLEIESREGGTLVPACDGEAPGGAGNTGMCTGTSIYGVCDVWGAGGAVGDGEV